MNIQYHYINNTKLLGTIRKYNDLSQNRKLITDVGKKGSNLDISFEISDDLSYYDCAVADAIFTLYKNEYQKFSLNQLIKVLSGNTGKALTEQNKPELLQSLKRLRSTNIRIDCTSEMKARGKLLDKNSTYILEGAFLTLEDTKKKYYLKDIEDMPLYKYAEENRQIIAVLPSLLDVYDVSTQKPLTNTSENILIKRYLIQRLEIMRFNNNIGREITYSWKETGTAKMRGMLHELEIDIDSYSSKESRRHKFLDIHATVKKILEYYKQLNYITDYEVTRAHMDGAIKGVRILGDIYNIRSAPKTQNSSNNFENL